jgi:hypothetical protein
MVQTQNTTETSSPNAQSVKDASARVEQKAREMYDVLLDTSTKWAGFGLEFGRNALTTSARALERAAERIAAIEEKLKKPSETPEAPETPKAPADQTAN